MSYDMSGFDGHVASLFDGGWRPEDADLMVRTYDVSFDEAERICERMREMIDAGVLKEVA